MNEQNSRQSESDRIIEKVRKQGITLDGEPEMDFSKAAPPYPEKPESASSEKSVVKKSDESRNPENPRKSVGES